MGRGNGREDGGRARKEHRGAPRLGTFGSSAAAAADWRASLKGKKPAIAPTTTSADGVALPPADGVARRLALKVLKGTTAPTDLAPASSFADSTAVAPADGAARRLALKAMREAAPSVALAFAPAAGVRAGSAATAAAAAAAAAAAVQANGPYLSRAEQRARGCQKRQRDLSAEHGCPLCKKRFHTNSALYQHMKAQARPTPTPNPSPTPSPNPNPNPDPSP